MPLPAAPADALPSLRQPDLLAESAATLLRDRILAGGFRPGERLVEAEIARQLGVSRGTVREALLRLRGEGLVRDEPRRGSFVAQLTVDDVREIYEMREAIESYAARLVIERGDADAIAELRRIGEELREAAADDDRDRFARLDLHLHEELTRLSGNARLHAAFVGQAGLLAALLRLEVATRYEVLDEMMDLHVELIEEIASGDPARAEEACRRHLRIAQAQVTEMVRSGGAR